MKNIYRYSQTKFESLSPVKQIKALDKLLSALELSLSKKENYTEPVKHILGCIAWMKPPLPKYISHLSSALQKEKSPEKISYIIAQYQKERGKTFKDYQIAVTEGDGLRVAQPEAKNKAQQMILILDNLRSAFNIGSIFRTAECLNLKSIYLCGVSATPKSSALKKTAMGTENKINWKYFTQTEDAILSAKAEGYNLYALETVTDASSVFEVQYNFPLALVVGNESLGISQSALKLCDYYLTLPVQGWKNSLNVAVACAICAYQIIFGNLPQQ
ncbi:MAG: RNA methyltransferase [Candidatus Cloacimonetes bacterium]|jgi:tRNA G18 (ribose-2'-O)-methylase SpoU|nr:RNA methyltransferase [Candidatus Cloacimonadota bacterium]